MTRYWAAIDSSLADAEKQLKDSRRQINDAKKKLEEQSGTAYAQLVAAAQQLADAKDQASLGSTLTSAEVKAIQAVLAQYDNMVNLRDSYNASEDYARTHLSAVKYAELQSLQLTRTQLRAQLRAAQASLETAEAALKEIGSSEAALQQDVTNAKDAQEAAQTAYKEARDGAPERLKDDPGWQDLLRQEQEKQAEVDDLQAQLEKDPDNTGLQAQLNTAEAELAAIQAAQTAYLTRNDPQTVAAAEKLSAAEEEVTRANARLETFRQATEAKAEAEKAIADATKAIEENTAEIIALLGEAEGKKWIESHDKVQDDYGTITELNAAIDALAPRIPQLKKELETAQSSQKELDAALSQLDKAQSQLETGKLELSQQLILATLQLQQAEQALDEAEEQFRQQRDAAYKAAGLGRHSHPVRRFAAAHGAELLDARRLYPKRRGAECPQGRR